MGVVCSAKTSEQILGNTLIDLERSGKTENLKGATKTSLLNKRFSYHSHCNKVLKLKEYRLKNHISDLTISEECCFPPKREDTRSMVSLYDRNKCISC